MKPLIFIAVFAFYALLNPAPKNAPKKNVSPAWHKPAPATSKNQAIAAMIRNCMLVDDKGNKYPMLDSTKKVNLVIFWASWCSACRMEIPLLKEIYPTLDPSGVRMISISVDKDKGEWLKAMKEEQMAWPQLLAEGESLKSIQQDFAFRGIPQIYFIDNKGKILEDYEGYHYDKGASFKALLTRYNGK